MTEQNLVIIFKKITLNIYLTKFQPKSNKICRKTIKIHSQNGVLGTLDVTQIVVNLISYKKETPVIKEEHVITSSLFLISDVIRSTYSICFCMASILTKELKLVFTNSMILLASICWDIIANN